MVTANARRSAQPWERTSGQLLNGSTTGDSDPPAARGGRLCLLKTPKGRERLEIFAPPPYRRGHDHDSFRRRFHTRLPASAPRLPGTRAHRAATSGECPAAAAPRSASAILYRPATLGGRVEDGRGRVGFRWTLTALSRRRLSPACRNSVSRPRSSNVACGFPALRSPVCFAPRVMRPILPRVLSADQCAPGSR